MIKGIYFDFGGVIGFPRPNLNRKYFYLNWDGLDPLLQDEMIVKYLRPGVGKKELEAFFTRELYEVFIAHEQSDLLDPQTGKLLLQCLGTIFDCSITPAFVNQILYYLNTMQYIDIDPRAVRLLRQLRDHGYCVSLISNMMLPGKLLLAKLEENGLTEYFNTITISSDSGFIKPHQEIFLRTLAQDGLAADEVLFVGDTYSQDIIGAKSVGMKTVWLNNHQPSSVPDSENPPDYILSDLMELTAKF